LKKTFFSIGLTLTLIVIAFTIGFQAGSKLKPHVNYFEYITAHEDTCERIAQTFNVSIASIIKLNNLSQCSAVKPDQILKIPYPSYIPAKKVSATRCPYTDCATEIYTVKDNETLSEIAQKFQTTEDVIISFNGLTTIISEGMKLVPQLD
jgi:LysM repeat protein